MDKKSMDELFISTIKSIRQIADMTTSGNVSHQIANIKASCQNMIELYESENTYQRGASPSMNKEQISELFGLLTSRIRAYQTLDGIIKKMRKCNDQDIWFSSCIVEHQCGISQLHEKQCREINDINMNIADCIERNGIAIAHDLSATRANCNEWLQERSKEHYNVCGDYGCGNKELAKELNIKL